jgi:peptidoglycan hydrolase FlgJ
MDINPVQTAALPKTQGTHNVDKAAKDFEAMYVSEMMAHMFAGLEVDSEFGGGKGEEMFRSMLVQEYGKQIANGPGIGISSQIRDMMIQMQEGHGG